MPKKVVNIVADTSPTIKRCRTAMPPDTGMSDMAGVPRLVLRDVTKLSYVVSDDNTLWYRNADRFIQIKPCKVKVIDVLKDHKFDPNDCKVSKCGSKNCKTCDILIADNSFSSNLTKRSFSTHSFENLSCKSYNIVYAIECTLCGLIYVGETKGELRKRMNGHRSQINNGGNQLLYRHFNLPDHSVLSMKVRILEKIYHPTNKPINSCTPFRRKREEYWIRQLGTAAPYGCNDHIDSIGNLTSPGCQSVNVLNLFDRTSRRHRSHGSRRYNKPEIHNVSFDGLLPFVNLQLGLHHIRTKLYSLPLKTLHVLYESTLTLHFTDVGSPEHRLQGIILDISSNRLFKAVRVCDSIETKNRPFLKIKFANKGIDALNLSNILNQKSVQSNIPPYFEYKESPCISYSYTNSVATNIFNYKTSLQQLDFQSLSQNPLPCSCSGSEFLYAPCGHIVTGDLNIVRNDKLRDLFRKGPKYREPVSFSWHHNFDIIMDACEAYARRWAKKEDVELDTLSEWIKSIGDVLKRRIRRLKHSVNTRHESIFSDPDVVSELSRLHENFVIVPADKASNNYTFVCKRYYVDTLIAELGLHLLPGNPTYNLTDFSTSEVLDNHKSVLTTFGIQTADEELDLPYIYWIPKMHKNPYKHRFIAGFSKCSTKPLSILLTKLLTHIKQGLQKYCETAYSRSGVNQMWILKNSKELLEHLQSPNLNHITSIKSFDFSTLYTTIPHQKLKSRLATIIRNSFIHKNGNRRYKFLVLGREGPYFVKEHSDSKNKYTYDDIINMLEFLVDNIFVVFGGKVFQQIVGIPMGTNCAPLLADIFLYSYEADFIQSLLSTGKKKLASQFNFTYRYIDDVLSINNPDFENYLGQMYPAELEIKDTTESNTSASYLDLLLSIESDGQLRTSLYDKRDDFNFHITNFPFLSSNIPSSPAYGVFISQLIRYARACSSYECFILRAARLSSKLLGQGYVMERLKSSLRKFYGRYGDLIKHYEVSLSQTLHDILGHDRIQ